MHNSFQNKPQKQPSGTRWLNISKSRECRSEPECDGLGPIITLKSRSIGISPYQEQTSGEDNYQKEKRHHSFEARKLIKRTKESSYCLLLNDIPSKYRHKSNKLNIQVVPKPITI